MLFTSLQLHFHLNEHKQGGSDINSQPSPSMAEHPRVLSALDTVKFERHLHFARPRRKAYKHSESEKMHKNFQIIK